ncbi:MAG TPA: tRNA pseudouridine(55) synthase TruB [Pyrinomonadaceae bacterium]|nr:tRNA pseudouridine(55) synthase TruB [Pyrinomonadaceae bacterium]
MLAMNGVLLIDKPAGMTSHDVVARVRKIIGERRVGHTGTLDPFATGLLVVLAGRATRLAQFLSGAEKEYEAVIRFGYATDTGDVTGVRIELESHAKTRSAQSLPKEEIEAAMAGLRGEIEQVPPMYSAKKIQGKKLYEFARAGQSVERHPVRVTIREFEMWAPADELLSANDDGSVDLRVRVLCSAGTYIRTLAEDLGQKLGIGSHLAELRRTRAGAFQINGALTLERLAEVCKLEILDDALVSPYSALSHLPEIELDTEQARRTMHGLALEFAPDGPPSLTDGDAIRLSLNNELIAVGRFDASQSVIHPEVVLRTE